jgi:Tfp pilus assembly protein PilF
MRVLGLLLMTGMIATIVGCLAPFPWAKEQPAAPDLEEKLSRADEALTKAAELLDKGQDAAAVPHLRTYVQANPDAVMVRSHLAELLFRQGQRPESRQHFERFVAQAQPLKGSVHQHLVHVHTRLMELAAQDDDDATEELHRGIGLLLLVKKWQASPERRDANAEEQTLMKCVKALRAVLELQPENGRAAVYLAQAYDLLGQVGPANEAYNLAKKHASGSDLTKMELALLNER